MPRLGSRVRIPSRALLETGMCKHSGFCVALTKYPLESAGGCGKRVRSRSVLKKYFRNLKKYICSGSTLIRCIFTVQETSLNFPVRNISKTEFLLQDNGINNWLYRNFFFPPSHGASAPPSQPSESEWQSGTQDTIRRRYIVREHRKPAASGRFRRRQRPSGCR